MALNTHFLDVTLSVEDRISKARIRLRRIAPFFSYIIEHLRTKQDDSIGTIGVTPKGLCLYNEKFIEKLTDNQLIGVMVHEIMHCALRHFTRQMNRTSTCNGMSIWNWAGDAQINQTVLENGLELPPEGVIPVDDEIDFGHIKIQNVSQKSTEELYNEIVAQLRRQTQENPPGGGSGSDNSDNSDDSNGNSSSGTVSKGNPDDGEYEIDAEIQKNFDEHLSNSEDDPENDSQGSSNSDGKPTNSESKESNSAEDSEIDGVPNVNWGDVLSEAYAHAKLIGKEPAGFDKLFADLHKPKVCWQSILRKTVASAIPEDFTWKRPHKKYIPHDIFLPSPYGETIKVICAIDTSGSIDQETLTDFISEIVGISKSYHEAEFIILSHDVNVHDEIPVRDSYRNKLQDMKLHGGGGTSHIPLFEYIEQHKLTWDLEATVVICFTDGYSDFPEARPKVDQIVFVLAGGHCPKDQIPHWADTVLSIDE